MVVPSKVFFTKGVGVHKDKLVSFEMALRDAEIEKFNLVYVSSIMPPDADIVTIAEGLSHLSPGEIVYCVMSKIETNEPEKQIASSIGLAVPDIHTAQHGYLSEHHTFDETSETCGYYAEDLAATMLATIMNIPFDPETAWQEREKVYRASGKIIKTSNITAFASGDPEGKWTTVIAAAVFVI